MIEQKESTLVTIGTVHKDGDKRTITVDSRYREALTGLDGFSHAIVVWWADRFEEHRFEVDNVIELPYAPGVKTGLLATRSPVRPNPICINTAAVVSVDVESGAIVLDEIDAFAGTRVLDIKPYYGCIDRVKEYKQPEWVPADWGEWYVPLPEMDYT